VRTLRFLVLLLVAAWVIVELAAVPVGTRLIEEQFVARSGGVAAVDASIGTFPVVSRFVLTGRVNTVKVTLDRVARLGLTFAEVRFELDGVAVDRAGLLRRQMRITDIDRGTVAATIDISGASPQLAAAADRNVRVAGRNLVIGPVSFRLSSELFPCDPQVRRLGAQVIASCTLTDVPPILLDAAQSI
jgi:hypothetical protein